MKVLVTGAGGMLARAVREQLADRGHAVEALARAELDVTDADAVLDAVRRSRPDAVVHCAAWTRVDDAERDEAGAEAVNAGGAANVARACREVRARFVYPSTDYVFDGSASDPYRPDGATAPINAYGRTKLKGEAAAREAGDHLVVRTSWLYGAGGANFVATILGRARSGLPLRVVDDQRGSPTWTRDLAAVLAGLLERGATAGTYHAANAGETTWYGLATEAVRLAGLDVEVEPVGSDAFPRPARRPRYSVLDCSATAAVVGLIPDWRAALARAIEEGV